MPLVMRCPGDGTRGVAIRIGHRVVCWAGYWCCGWERKDFFVSHAGADRAWAEWVAWQRGSVGSPIGWRRPDVGGGGGNRLEAEPLQDRPAGSQRVDLQIAVAAGGGQARPVRDQGTEDPPAAPGRNGS